MPRKKKTGITIQKIAKHRNGIGGNVFHVVLFHDHAIAEDMMAVVFRGECRVAVLAMRLLSQGIIEFGENSWRGDEYAADLDKAIRAVEKERS